MMILFVFTFIYQPTNGQIDMMSLFPKDHLFSDFLQSKENSELKVSAFQKTINDAFHIYDEIFYCIANLINAFMDSPSFIN